MEDLLKKYNIRYITNENIIYSCGKAVHQIELFTGKILNTFDSLASAAQSIDNNCNYSNISLCCKGGRPSAYGYKWKFVENKKIMVNNKKIVEV